MEQQPIALITGATGGLGRAFVEALAKENYHLILTGREEKKLLALQEELQRTYPQIKTYICAANLANEGGRYAFMDKIAQWNLPISMLVNVAGADVQKGLCAYTQEKISFQCAINFEAAVSLCHFAISHRAEDLKIINISSVSGIYPMPYFAIYSATKGALTSFSMALREEMRGKNVSVTAVLPGAMPTREDIKEQIKGQGLWGRLAAKTPYSVAVASIKAARKNKRKVIVGFWNKVMRISTIWLPECLRLRFIAKRWSKIEKDAF